MKTLVFSLATVCMLMACSTASAAVKVQVGPVGVAVGRRVPRRVHPVYAAPRPTRAAVVHTRRNAAYRIAEERHATFQDVVEERRDTAQDVREDRVDRARDIIQTRRLLWELFQASQL